MKIVYDNQIFYNQIFGGPSRYFAELIKELTKINCQTKIISPFHQNIYLKELSPNLKIEFTTKLRKNFFTNKLNLFTSNFFF